MYVEGDGHCLGCMPLYKGSTTEISSVDSCRPLVLIWTHFRSCITGQTCELAPHPAKLLPFPSGLPLCALLDLRCLVVHGTNNLAFVPDAPRILFFGKARIATMLVIDPVHLRRAIKPPPQTNQSFWSLSDLLQS